MCQRLLSRDLSVQPAESPLRGDDPNLRDDKILTLLVGYPFVGRMTSATTADGSESVVITAAIINNTAIGIERSSPRVRRARSTSASTATPAG